MYYEPYGLLDVDVLETYIRSVRKPEVTTNIRKTFMAIDRFLNSVEVSEEKSEGTLQQIKSIVGDISDGKAQVLYNKVKKNKPLSDVELGDATLEQLQEVIKSNTTVRLKVGGKYLTDFQEKLVTHIKRKYSRLRQGDHQGIGYILNLIDKIDQQTSASPYILSRAVERVIEYQNPGAILKALDFQDWTAVRSAIGNISNFEDSFLKNTKENSRDKIVSLINSDRNLSYLLTVGGDPDLNRLASAFLDAKIGSLSYSTFNLMLGTSYSEKEIHFELLDLLEKGLVGFNLCTDTLKEALSSGCKYQVSEFDDSVLKSNVNIQFITQKLKPLLELELDYRRK